MRIYRFAAALAAALGALALLLPAARAQSEQHIHLPLISSAFPRVVVEGAGPAAFQLYAGRADGNGFAQLTFAAQGQGSNSEPRWSPAEDRIAFLSNRDGQIHIYLMRPDGSQQTRLTSGGAGDERLAGWSPDGRRLLFYRQRQLFVIDADGGNLRALASQVDGASWGPDGARLVYSAPAAGGQKGSALYRINTDGSGQQLITSTVPLSITAVEWSPDGARIAYQVPLLTEDGILMDIDTYIVDADGGSPTRLAGAFSLAWSPDGRRAAFSTLSSLWAADPDGANRLRLATLPEPNVLGTNIYAGDWSRDGAWVAYRISNRAFRGVNVVRSDGGARYSLTSVAGPLEQASSLAWGRP